MKNLKQTRLGAACLIIGMGATTLAVANEDLVRKNGCLGCHANSQKIVGPSWQDVAVKYKAQPDAANTLAQSIVKGSTGKWGVIPMPAQAQLSPADALSIAGWMLMRP